MISSPWIRRGLAGFGIFALLALAFAAGVDVGERKARHFAAWSDRYETLVRPPGRRPPPFPPLELPPTHAAFGRVVSVAPPFLVLQDRASLEHQILLTSSTAIRFGRADVPPGRLRPDAGIAVFGMPNAAGQIEARLVRILEEPAVPSRP